MVSSIGNQFLVASECMKIASAMRKSPRWASAGIATILSAPSSGTLGTFENEFPQTDKLMENASHEAPKAPEENVSKESPNLKRESSNGADSASSTDSINEGADQEGAGEIDTLSNPENDLIMGFTTLRANLTEGNADKIDVISVCRPFLEVIKSSLVSGHITSLALFSLQKFFESGLINPHSASIEQCLKESVHALTHCRFEGNDRQEDDSVLLQLMDLLSQIIRGPCGPLLSDVSVNEIVGNCLSMTMQMKRKDILRQNVISTLLSVVRTVFSHLDSPSMLNSAQETLTTFVNISDPSKPVYTNNLRITILTTISTCFEVGGNVISEKESFKPVLQTLWKYLAQLIRVTNHPTLLKSALQLVSVLMNSDPRTFKTQFEFILVYLLTSLTPLNDLPRDDSTDDMFYAGVPNRAKCIKSAPIEPGSNILAIPTAAVSKTPEIREVMVEALSTMAVSSPTFFPDLFLNYDCDTEYPDLCEDLVGFLCRNAYPDSASWSNAYVPPLCLEAVLSSLSSWANYTAGTSKADVASRLSCKSRKALEVKIAETFNESQSKGVKQMIEHGLVKSDKPEDLAEFIFKCKRLNKAVLGKYFAKAENKDIFGAYLRHLDFTNMRLDEALRDMLCYFRLPGEAGQIDNLMTKFSQRYIECGEKPEKDAEGAHVLAYAVLMLNTDHYSPTVKRKMDYDAFHKNVRLVGLDAPEEYVRALYDGITTQELIMPEEHDTDETFEHIWRESVTNANHSDPFFVLSNADNEVVKAMFNNNWRPIVSTLSFVFATASDDLVFRRVIYGFHQLALLATRFKSQQALNHIIACLSEISILTSGDLLFNDSNIEIRIEDHAKVVVSDLSTQFGADLKAQMASITLFRILNVTAAEASTYAMGLVAKALTNLYLYGLYKPTILPGVKPIHIYHSFERSKAGKPVGILSALSSYLTSSADTPSEPSDENVDAALSASDCIKACRVDDTLSDLIKAAPKAFANGSLSVLPKDNGPQYLPAKDFLLNAAGFAAGDEADLKKIISEKALDAGLVSSALSVADNEQKKSIMDNIERVDDETLRILLTCSPSPNLWRLIGLVPSPVSNEVLSYISTNVDSASNSPSTLSHVLNVIHGSDKSDDKSNKYDEEVIKTLEDLAHANRNKPSYANVLGALGELCGSGNAKTRENSLSSLQREFLIDQQCLSWAQAANEVIVPHILEILVQPKVWKKDPSGMDITRQQVASLIGKVFLHLTVSADSQETNEDTDAWVSVLKMLDRLLTSRRQPALQESIEEMLKNVILVTKLGSRGSKYFWEKTENELKGFLPEIAVLVSQDPKDPEQPESVTEDPSSKPKDESKKENKENEEEVEESKGEEKEA